MYRRSFLQPTSSTGVCGQKRRISGYHMALQFRNDTGFVIEKHRSTTSDLRKKEIRTWKVQASRFLLYFLPEVSEAKVDVYYWSPLLLLLLLFFFIFVLRLSLTCRKRIDDPFRDRRMCPIAAVKHLRCPLSPRISLVPDNNFIVFVFFNLLNSFNLIKSIKFN